MPIANPIESSQLLTAGLRAEFSNTYRRSYEGTLARVGRVMDLGIPSDKLTEIFGYFKKPAF